MRDHQSHGNVTQSEAKVLRNGLVPVILVLAGVMLLLLAPSSRLSAASPCGLYEYLPENTEFEATFLDPDQIESVQINISEDLILSGIPHAKDDKGKLAEDVTWKGKLPDDVDGKIKFKLNGELPLTKIGTDHEGNIQRSYVLEHKKGEVFPICIRQDQTIVLVLKKDTVIQQHKDTNKFNVKESCKASIDLGSSLNLKVRTKNGKRLRKAANRADRAVLEIKEPARAAQGHKITLELRDFDQEELKRETLQACFRSHDLESIGKSYVLSPEVEIVHQDSGTAELRVTVPKFPDGLPGFRLRWLHDWLNFGATPVQIKVIAFDGEKITLEATTNFVVSSVGFAIVIGVVAFVISYLLPILIFRRFKANNEPVFKLTPIWLAIGRTGKASLSLFQIWLWTLLVFSSAVYVLAVSGQLIKITDQILILLGISGVASLASKFTAISREERGLALSALPNGSALVKEAPQWVDLISTGGRFDVFKFQMLLFTGLTALFVLFSVLADLRFPEVPESFLWLMGISNGVYLGGKLTTTNVFADIETIHRELQAAKEKLANDKAKMEKEKSDFDSQIKQLDEELNGKNEELTRLEKDTEIEEEEKKQKVQNLNDEIKKIKGQKSAISKNIEQLESKHGIKQSEETVKELEKKFQAAKTKIEKLVKNDPTDPL